MNSISVSRRSAATKWLHWLAALTIIAQLALSLVMQSPGRNRPGDSWFELHEKVGIAVTVILVSIWLWSLVRSGETRLVAFFPWLSPKQIKLVFADARNLFADTHAGPAERPFASAVHGLGLVIATIMALSGLIGYFIASARWLLGIHETVAPLMWAYLVGHVAMSIIHELRGQRIIGPMLGMGSEQRSSKELDS